MHDASANTEDKLRRLHQSARDQSAAMPAIPASSLMATHIMWPQCMPCSAGKPQLVMLTSSRSCLCYSRVHPVPGRYGIYQRNLNAHPLGIALRQRHRLQRGSAPQQIPLSHSGHPSTPCFSVQLECMQKQIGGADTTSSTLFLTYSPILRVFGSDISSMRSSRPWNNSWRGLKGILLQQLYLVGNPVMELLTMTRITKEPVNATYHTIAQPFPEGHTLRALFGSRQHGRQNTSQHTRRRNASLCKCNKHRECPLC